MTAPQQIKEECSAILRECGFNILGFIEHHFDPQGYTALWLLGESHFAIHTFPEFGCSYYELSSCNREYFETFLRLTENWNNI